MFGSNIQADPCEWHDAKRFIVVPQVSAQANGPPVITPTKANPGDNTMEVDPNIEEEITFAPEGSDETMEEMVGDPDPEEETTDAVESVVKFVDLTKPASVEGGGTVSGEKQGVIFGTSTDGDKDSLSSLVPAPQGVCRDGLLKSVDVPMGSNVAEAEEEANKVSNTTATKSHL